MEFICVTPRDVFESIRNCRSLILSPLESAATLLMFDEKILRYNAYREHRKELEVFESINMLVTLYGQRERLAARSLVKHHIPPQQFENESTWVSAQWLSHLLNPMVLALAITSATNSLLVTHGEFETMFGTTISRAAVCTVQDLKPDDITTTFTGLVRSDWLVTSVPAEELGLAVVFMLKNVQQSPPYEAFFRYVTFLLRRRYLVA